MHGGYVDIDFERRRPNAFGAMADHDPERVASITLSHIAGVRRDVAHLTERQTHTYDVISRMHATMLQMLDEMRDGFAAIRKDINGVRSDIVSLENQNFSRHGEMINLQRRFDEQE